MWLVDRFTDGLGGGRIALPSLLETALVRWYAGRGTAADEEAGIVLVQQARIGGKWFACGCRGDMGAPPLLTPAFLSEAETYYLRRLSGTRRPEHRVACPFFRDQATNRVSEIRGGKLPADPPDGFFAALRPAPSKLAQAPPDMAIDDRSRHATLPRLARLLLRLLWLSGQHISPAADGASRSIGQAFAAMRAAAARIEVAPGLALDRVLWTHGDAIHSRCAYAQLRALASHWPAGHAPQGFAVLFAAKVHGNVIHAAGCDPIEVVARVQSPSSRAIPIGGPYLTLIVIGEFPERRGYAPLRAFAQPIVSGHALLPVEIEAERSVASSLLRLAAHLSRRGINLTVERPLFDTLTPTGPMRPDFLLGLTSRTTGDCRRCALLLTSPDVSEKARLASGLAALAPVIAIDEGQHDLRSLEAVLRSTLKMW